MTEALTIIIIIISLIYIVQFNTNGILTVLYIVITYIQMQFCAHMNIHETIIFIHMYMSTHKHIHRHMYKYISTNILTRDDEKRMRKMMKQVEECRKGSRQSWLANILFLRQNWGILRMAHVTSLFMFVWVLFLFIDMPS